MRRRLRGLTKGCRELICRPPTLIKASRSNVLSTQEQLYDDQGDKEDFRINAEGGQWCRSRGKEFASEQ